MSQRVLIPVDMDQPPALPPGLAEHRLGGATMGTSWSVRVMAPQSLAVADIASTLQAGLQQVIEQMSTWESNSLVSRYNRAPAGSWHGLPPAFYTVLDAALTMAFDSAGAFDPTIGPLVNLWGFGPRSDAISAVLPDSRALESARARCGWQRVELDRDARRVLQPGGVYLDFSGIAKGYAVDLLAQSLRALGCASWLVEVGGELSGFGVKADGQPWWVALERPPQDQSGQPTVVALHGLAIATSGDYRRYFEHGKRRYAHTIDPRSAQPVAHDLVSVTVLHHQCMVADALATVLTVLGAEAGLHFAAERNIAALFISGRDGQLHERMSPALAAMMD